MDGSYDHFSLSVCRLCLEVKNDNCSTLTEETWTILKELIPEMTIFLSMDNVTKICNICTEVLQTTYKFRKECFNNDNQKKHHTDENICLLCQKDNVDVQEEQDNKRSNTQILHESFPDLEIDFKGNSACCKECLELLEKFLTFVKNCRKTEEDIRSYFLSTGNSSQEANIKLEEVSEVSEFISSNSSTAFSENISPKTSPSDNEVNENSTTSKKRKQPGHSKKTTLANKYNCTNCSYSAISNSVLIRHMIKHRTLSETTDFKCKICNHRTKRKGDLKAHMIIHKDSTELKMFKCTLCPYEGKRNGDLKQHMNSHGVNVYKCKYCPFQTAHQKYLEKRHMLKHRDKSEQKVYKCDKCSYQTTIEPYFRGHAITHSEEWFSCNSCAYTTRRKVSLKEHIYLIHSPTSEINMFKCANCEYKTKRKGEIKKHIMRHHVNSAQQMVKCEKCNLTLKNKETLAKHLRQMHPKPSQVRSFECHTCGFLTRRKESIKSHLFKKHFVL